MCFNLRREDDHKLDNIEQHLHSKCLLFIQYIQDLLLIQVLHSMEIHKQ